MLSALRGRLAGVLFLCGAVLAASAAHAAGERVNSGEAAPVEPLPEELAEDLVTAEAISRPPVFAGGEELEFKLGWSFFRVARARLEVIPGIMRGREALQIVLHTRTNSFADAFYKVRNRSFSWIAADLSSSFHYQTDQNEGGDTREVTAVFDPVSSTAHYTRKSEDGPREPIRIRPGTFDPLGIVFFVRGLDFAVGDRLVIPTSNGKEFFYTVVHVVEKVRRKFLSGRHEAYVLEPDIKDLGGVFKRSPDGEVRFFFSADERKLPLRMESEVAVGRFWAELVEIPASASRQ